MRNSSYQWLCQSTRSGPHRFYFAHHIQDVALYWAGVSHQAHFYKSFAELAAGFELHLILASFPNAGMVSSRISSPWYSREVIKNWARLRPTILFPFQYHKDSRQTDSSKGRDELSIVSSGIRWHQSSLVQGCSAMISASRSAPLCSTETAAPTATAPKTFVKWSTMQRCLLQIWQNLYPSSQKIKY